VFADFDAVREDGDGLLEVPIDPDSTLGQEWTVIVDAPGFGACLIAWETDEGDRGDLERRFEALWTLDPRTVRHASHAAAGLVAHADPDRGERVQELLQDRPTALEHPTSALTALTNRMVEYLD
jgi:DICT domain-containing protein